MLLQKIESAEWKNYNANTRDARVGDCVKRALTIAYSMDYDEVSKELNRIKRINGKSAYNLTSVYYKFCEARGNKFQPISVNRDRYFPDLGSNEPIQVADVCDTLQEGTYLLEVSKKPSKYTDHLCVVVDGKLYDSWDSRKWYVDKWSIVTTVTTDVFDIRWQDISDIIDEYLLTYLNKLESKYSDYSVSFQLGNPEHVNRYTYELVCFLRFAEFPPQSSKYHRCKTWGHRVTVKLNPRMNEDTNCSILQKKISQKIYDWVYNVIKDVKDAKATEEFDWSDSQLGHYHSSDDKKLIMNLPEWCRKYIKYVEYDPNLTFQNDKYEVTMKALPDDPYADKRGDSVYFYADTLTELKRDLEYYRTDYARFNYEY